jgi:hypothetical protein
MGHPRSMASVLSCPVLFAIGGHTAMPIGLKIGTNTHWNYEMKIGGRRSRVRIYARTAHANVRATPHIQHRRPNSWTDIASNWYTHSLGQWAKVMGVGDRECALMCALRAQTCAHHYTSSIGGQTGERIGAKLVQTLIGTMGRSYGGRRSRERFDARAARKFVHIHHISIICGQTAGPIGAHIGTNTYWDNGQKLWWSAIASAH